MAKPTRRTLAALVGLATVGTAVAVPLNALASANTLGAVIDGCGTRDRITLSGGADTDTYKVLGIDSKGVESEIDEITGNRVWERPDDLRGNITVRVVDQDGLAAKLYKSGTPTGTEMPFTDLTCVSYAEPQFIDNPGKDNDWYVIPSSPGVDYLVGSTPKAAGRYPGSGIVAITARAQPGRTLSTGLDSAATPIPDQPVAFDPFTFSATSTIAVPAAKAPTIISDPDGDAVRIWNIPGVAWTVNGTAVKLSAEPYKDAPTGGKSSVFVAATAADPKSYEFTGTSSWTLAATGTVTIAKDKVPTASDQPGARNDTVTVHAVPGVKWKVNGADVTFPAGATSTQISTAGKGSVTVTAATADPNKYRLTGTTSWPLIFKLGTQITIPESRHPLVNDLSGTANDTVTVYAVDRVTWTVGRTEVTFDKGETSKNVPTGGATRVIVKATVATGSTSGSSGKTGSTADAEISGTDTWELSFNDAVNSTSARPSVAARANEVALTPRTSLVRWAAPTTLKAPATYDVAYRIVNLNSAGRRVATAWKPWLGRTTATSGVFSGLPGGVYEVTVRATGADGTVSAWSGPGRVLVPMDIRRPGGRAGAAWKVTADKRAVSGTMVTTATRGATWAIVTPPTDRIMAWVGTGPTNGYVNVLVDGKLRARVNTWSARPYAKAMLINVPVSWGKHRVAFVNAPYGKRAVTKLDALAYNR